MLFMNSLLKLYFVGWLSSFHWLCDSGIPILTIQDGKQSFYSFGLEITSGRLLVQKFKLDGNRTN